jgi:hypothetical protein
MLDGTPYAKLNIAALIALRDIQHGFRQVPLDAFVHDRSRFKDIVRFLICGRNVIKTPHGDLFHPINSGAYGGCASRTYPEVPASDIEPLTALIEIFARTAGINVGREILLQRQRVITDDDRTSPTVREGPHQDGVQKLAILCVNRANIDGGVSLIYNDRLHPIFTGVLEPGDILFIDDAQLWHDATPIRRVDPGRPGHRDVILLTWPACREHENLSTITYSDAPRFQAA